MKNQFNTNTSNTIRTDCEVQTKILQEKKDNEKYKNIMNTVMEAPGLSFS